MTQRLLLTCALALSLTGCTAIVDSTVDSNHAECVRDADCPTLDACVGSRSCDLTTHACVVNPGTGPNCDDADTCTTDGCDSSTGSATCTHVQVDGDHDGYSPGVCKVGGDYETKGNDCDDNSNGVNPGVSEVCANSIDDNCNGQTDAADPTATQVRDCYRDADGDGFHNLDDKVQDTCKCRAGYIEANAIGADCADGVFDAKPNVADFFDHPYCKSGNTAQAAIALSGGGWGCPVSYYLSWDYNCASGNEQALTTASTTCGGCFVYTTFTTSFTTFATTFAASKAAAAASYCFNRWDSMDGSVTTAPACGDYAYRWTANTSTCNRQWAQQLCR